MLPLDYFGKARTLHWIAVAVFILLVDFATGPFIQFPILFVLPVGMATASHGRVVGAAVGALLPLIRLSFFLQWKLPAPLTLEVVDTATDIAILVGFAFLVDQLIRQQREIRVLQGMLPICGFCKRIREEDGGWRQLEAFISERSSARFTHTFCEECGRKHYGDMAE
jgi:hypothetical protein